MRHRLSDDEWDLISDLFPKPTGVGRPPNNPRDMMDGILWVLRTGAPWRDVPQELGRWSSVWDAFDRWNSDGTLAEILSRLIASHVDVGAVGTDLWLVDLNYAPAGFNLQLKNLGNFCLIGLFSIDMAVFRSILTGSRMKEIKMHH